METATISNNWRNNLRVKHLFEDTTTPELVVKLCDSIVSQLTNIQERESKGSLKEEEKFHIDYEIENLLGNFQFLKDLATGDVPESEWKDYEFDGDYERLFNGYLSELYDLGDKRVLTSRNVVEKFMWID